MPTVTVRRSDVTSEEVCRALSAGLGEHYNVVPGMEMGRSAIRAAHPVDEPDKILVGTGSNRIVKAEVKIVRKAGQTQLRIMPGGLSWDIVLNSLGIARKVRKVLAAASFNAQ